MIPRVIASRSKEPEGSLRTFADKATDRSVKGKPGRGTVNLPSASVAIVGAPFTLTRAVKAAPFSSTTAILKLSDDLHWAWAVKLAVRYRAVNDRVLKRTVAMRSVRQSYADSINC